MKKIINVVLCLGLFVGLVGVKDLFNRFNVKKSTVAVTATVPAKGKIVPIPAKASTVPAKGLLFKPTIPVKK